MSDAHGRSIALTKFLSKVTRFLGVSEHVYVVGGAVRNWILGKPIKDIDVVIDTVALKGRDSAWLASQLEREISAKTSLVTNNYGVAILTISGPWQLEGFQMKGETIEIANARKESYGGASGKGYKPHMVEPATIREDLVRREFTVNTLMWRLADLAEGPAEAQVLDYVGDGAGMNHIRERLLVTPADPDKTFSDDPTRMLRAVKFAARYGFQIAPSVFESIQRNAPKLKDMPWDAIRKLLVNDILEGPVPCRSIGWLKQLGLADVLREMLGSEPGFATAVSRALKDHPLEVSLDLLDLGWPVSTPVSFLAEDGLADLRRVLNSFCDPARAHQFSIVLLKPALKLNQVRLFEKFNIPPEKRSIVTRIARRQLLADPCLAWDSHTLEECVDSELSIWLRSEGK